MAGEELVQKQEYLNISMLCFNGANWEIQTLFESQTTGHFKIEKKKEIQIVDGDDFLR